ncbi:MAG TPA: hypothetical protein VGJ21_24920 [Terracidiphilus sp.]|jgi:hypothetical protein
MNWRRGLLFAAIHLAVAVPMVTWEEATRWDWLREREIRPIPPPAPSKPGDGESVTFSPCGLWENYGAARTVVYVADFPAVALSGWRLCSPPSWSVSHFAGATALNSTRAIEKKTCIGLGVIIVLFWMVAGSFPLTRTNPWYAEPGAVITASTLASLALVALFGTPSLIEQARAPAPHFWHVPSELLAAAFPSLLAGLAWYWWFGLLVWKLVRGLWRRTVRRGAGGAASEA